MNGTNNSNSTNGSELNSLHLVNLSNVNYEDIHQDIINYLTAREEITEILPTSLINTLIACQASITAGLSSAVQVATQEVFLDTAYNSVSILANAINLGAFIKRKDPANIKVKIINTSEETITVPRFSAFSLEGTKIFNRDAFELPPDATIELTFYEGEEVTEEFIATGEDYETFFLSKTLNFQISTEDIYAIETHQTETIIYECTKEALYTTGSNSSQYMQQKTLPTGSVILKTGNGTYGKKPTEGSKIEVHYIKTQGSAVTLAVEEGTKITSTINGLLITTESALQNGGDEMSVEFYQNYASSIASSAVTGGCVTLEQLTQYALQFSGIADCKLLGQRDTFPDNLRYLNVIQATILTHKGIITDEEWAEFVEYMKQKTTFEFVRVDPIGINIDIEISVVVSKSINADLVKTQIENAFKQYFELKIGSIGKCFYISDIGKILRTVLGVNELVRFSVILPVMDKIITSTQYLKINRLSVSVSK